MKVLKKNEKATEEARYRTEQIDEGVSLATKIDTLRRTLATVEKQYNDFISTTKERTEKELGSLNREIEQKRDELKSLEKTINGIREKINKFYKDINGLK